MELVLSQQSSPSSESAPETPITDTTSVTSDPPDLTPDPPSPTPSPSPSPALAPDPPAAQPEVPAPPTETTPPEPDVQEEDQVKPEPAHDPVVRQSVKMSRSLSPVPVWILETDSVCFLCLVQTWDPEEVPVLGRRASLSDLSCLDDIEALSVRQLKEILARNFVDYKGCCEKWELMERVSRLYQDQQNLLGEPAYKDLSLFFSSVCEKKISHHKFVQTMMSDVVFCLSAANAVNASGESREDKSINGENN